MVAKIIAKNLIFIHKPTDYKGKDENRDMECEDNESRKIGHHEERDAKDWCRTYGHQHDEMDGDGTLHVR